MIIELTIPQTIVHNLTVEEAVEFNLTGILPPGGGGNIEAFPVGSVFTTVVNTNPSELLGYGTWESFANGRVLIGQDATDPDFQSAEQIGGSKEVAAEGVNSQPEFTGVDLGEHNHNPVSAGTPGGTVSEIGETLSPSGRAAFGANNVADFRHRHPAPTFTGQPMQLHDHGSASVGKPEGSVSAPEFTGSPTSVIQPYIVVHFWVRTA